VKFTADRDDLLGTFSAASRAATNGATLGSNGLHLKLSEGVLTATGADPDLVIAATMDVGSGDDGSTILPPRLVTDIIRSFKSGAVEFGTDDDSVRIASDQAEFTLRTVVGDSILNTTQPTETVEIAGAVFAEGLRQVVRCALKDDSRSPQLTGVLVTTTKNGLRLVATDSYRLAVKDIDGLTVDVGAGCIIPARALAEVRRLVDKDSSVTFGRTDLDATFTVGNVSVTTRLLRGQYPDYERLLPDKYAFTFTTDRKELIAGVKRVGTMVKNAKDDTTPVRLFLSVDKVGLSVQVPEDGGAVDAVNGVGTPKSIALTIAFNPKFLLDGLDAIAGDKVALHANDAFKPATMSGANGDGYEYLLMPVKVA
jgi:DNA polymerase-3 subunit beta